MSTPIYLVIINHDGDPSYTVVKSVDKAVKYARAELKHYPRPEDDIEDHTEQVQRYDKTILHKWVYSCEGDYIEVREIFPL